MIEFHLSVDALGKTRFAYSPLAEVACSLRLPGEDRHGYVMMPWLRDVRGQLQRLNFDLLQALAPPGRWAPDFLFDWSYNPAITIEQQLDAMSRLPGAQIGSDLRDTWKDGTVPSKLEELLSDEAALPGRVSDLIFDYWQVAMPLTGSGSAASATTTSPTAELRRSPRGSSPCSPICTPRSPWSTGS